MQSLVHANQCLDLMERRRVGRNVITYTELLKVCKNSVNLDFLIVGSILLGFLVSHYLNSNIEISC